MSDPFALPARPALFLDFDGTLVDIAARPDAVQIPPELPGVLARLAAALDGALAVVSGRPLMDLDLYLPIPIAKAGDHGASLRLTPDAPVEAPALPAPPISWRARALSLVEAFPGALLEEKAHGFVIHYRQEPEAGEPARILLEELLEEMPGAFTLLPARMAWEVKPRGVSKGTAVAALLARPPFVGRTPVFIGDDVTDEAGMAAARAAGGLGLKLQDVFGEPAALRAWLSRLEAGLSPAPSPAEGTR
jgi:trehalose 6-phosphate phosphatase